MATTVSTIHDGLNVGFYPIGQITSIGDTFTSTIHDGSELGKQHPYDYSEFHPIDTVLQDSSSIGELGHIEWWSYPLNHIQTERAKDVYGYNHDIDIHGKTLVENTPTKCKLYVFNKSFELVDVLVSDTAGDYKTNEIYEDNGHYIVCVSLDTQCPDISGMITPVNANIPVVITPPVVIIPPVILDALYSTNGTIINDLSYNNPSASWNKARATTSHSSGKFVFETLLISGLVSQFGVGIINTAVTEVGYIGQDVNGWGYLGDGYKTHSGYININTPMTTSTPVMITVDFDLGNISVIIDNVETVLYTGESFGECFASLGASSSESLTNFGDSSFYNTIPAGYSAWNI